MTTSRSRSGLNNPKKSLLWDHAQTFLGTPYRLGGSDRSGMDCSGLVVRLYRDVYGIKLPHSTDDLYRKGHTVSLRALDAGDLVFFRETKGTNPSHVGVYLGEGHFIHASSTRGVILSGLKDVYYKKRVVGVRRISGK
jgi:probable lipoprotein NlpC